MILLYDTMPADSLVKVVKRNKNDSEGDILDQKKDQIPGTVRHIRLKESPYAAHQPVGNHQRRDKQILKFTPGLTK